MQINIRNMQIGTKITIILEFIIGCIFIILGMASKEILGITSGILLWIFVVDMLIIASKDRTIEMLTMLCDVQQEILAEKIGCTRAEIDQMCTERLIERNKKVKIG